MLTKNWPNDSWINPLITLYLQTYDLIGSNLSFKTLLIRGRGERLNWIIVFVWKQKNHVASTEILTTKSLKCVFEIRCDPNYTEDETLAILIEDSVETPTKRGAKWHITHIMWKEQRRHLVCFFFNSSSYSFLNSGGKNCQEWHLKFAWVIWLFLFLKISISSWMCSADREDAIIPYSAVGPFLHAVLRFKQ